MAVIMRCFVTGGAGFIGSHLVSRMIPKHGVTVYDNLSSGRRELIKGHLKSKNFRFIRGELLNASNVLKDIKGHDMVFHLAANPDIRGGLVKTDLDLKLGTVATYNVLEAMRRNDVPKMIFASSSVVYGEPNVFPTPEDYGPLMPISLYGASKLACEGLISAFSHVYGIRAWVFRLANIVGPNSTHGLMFDLVEKLNRDRDSLEVLGDGLQRKSYLYVDDCIDGMLLALERSNEPVNVFNLGSRDQIEVRRIADILLETMDLPKTKIEYTGGRQGWRGDVPVMMMETKKMLSLGWKPGHDSEEAVRLTCRSLRPMLKGG